MSKAKFFNLSFEFMPSTKVSRYHTIRIRIWTKLAVASATLFLIVVLLKSHRLQFILHYTLETVTSSRLQTPGTALASDLLTQYLVVTIRAEKTTVGRHAEEFHYHAVTCTSPFSISFYFLDSKSHFSIKVYFSKEQAEPLFRNLQTVACKGACC